MTDKQPATDDQKRDQLIQSFSQAAARAHDKGNDAAAHGLTTAAIKLMTDKK